MSMTVGLFERFVSEMESLGAERVLDMARASVAQFQQQAWWDALYQQAQGQRAVDAAPAARAGQGFSLNGASMSFDALFVSLAGVLGPGVSA